MALDPPTLYDLAREAGVSLATASRVVNGSERRVADAYRVRVLEAAERIGYRANQSAQAMARGTSRIVAMLVSDIADPFFSLIAAGVSAAAERHGLLVSMSVTGRDPDRELELLRELRGIRPRLVVLVGSRMRGESNRDAVRAELEGFESAGARVVVVGAHDLPFATAGIDDAAGARDLATALVASGRRSFAVLAGPPGLTTAEERTAGFISGLEAAGLRGSEVRVLRGATLTRDAGFDAGAALASDPGEVDALFAVTDVMAIGALTALREAGVAVPGRIAVAGFDDIPGARDASPALTTVRIELGLLGERAVELALGADPRATELLPTRVILRASTGH